MNLTEYGKLILYTGLSCGCIVGLVSGFVFGWIAKGKKNA